MFRRKCTREPPRDGLVEEDEGQQSMGMNRPFLSLAQAAYGEYSKRVMYPFVKKLPTGLYPLPTYVSRSDFRKQTP